MAKKVTVGSFGPFLFDDTSTFQDGSAKKAMTSDSTIEVSTPAGDPTGDEVVSAASLAKRIARVEVADMDNPTELSALDPLDGTLAVVTKPVASTQNVARLYYGDASKDGAAHNPPANIDGVGSSRWYAIDTDGSHTYSFNGIANHNAWNDYTRPGTSQIQWDSTDSLNPATGAFSYITNAFNQHKFKESIKWGVPATDITKTYEMLSVTVHAVLGTADVAAMVGTDITTDLRIFLSRVNVTADSSTLTFGQDSNSSAEMPIHFYSSTSGVDGANYDNLYKHQVFKVGTTLPATSMSYPSILNPNEVWIFHIQKRNPNGDQTSAANLWNPTFSITLKYKEKI
tara:strand:- start:5156 stop:6181 length:1026 start_codon:yes stop_codon:yes gene_type:complete